MSEFKYACPVCGQHIKCDSSQSGSVMECPTCFQKIIAPQAPATDDPKFIITGTKVGGERPAPSIPTAAGNPIKPAKSFSGVAIVLAILICMAAAATFVYHGTIFKSQDKPAVEANTPNQSLVTNQSSAIEKPAQPTVATPVNDTNWTLSLAAVTIPDSAAAGRVHGENSLFDRAVLQGGVLTLRPGVRVPSDMSVAISFNGALPEALTGQTISVATNTEQAARVTLRWKDGDQSVKENFDKGYALHLEFGALTNNHLAGKIYLCTPDFQKSYALGTFNAEIRKPKTPKQKN